VEVVAVEAELISTLVVDEAEVVVVVAVVVVVGVSVEIVVRIEVVIIAGPGAPIVVVVEVEASTGATVVIVVVVEGMLLIDVVCVFALLGSVVVEPSTCSRHCSPAWHLAPSKCVPGAHDMCLATQPVVPNVPNVLSKLLVPNVR